ncbi:hypothetical protein QNH23_13350 [Siminovitchia fortis]|uniref:hypothetical protein n=1 Tax=Siminovitchia fortis TaxID=254758 RepID=UPI0024C17E53|nr:hypothetical protein [Siminovitchia fortis]WHY80893.1 hypothetical protein QNH23_13350 [Siminovitchia fortis]
MGLSMKDTFLAKYYMKEGEKKGIEVGIKEGKVEIAVRLLGRGESADDVAEITGLTLEEVERIKDRN